MFREMRRSKQQLTREETETLLLEASRRKMGEISGMLMEFKYHKFPEKKKKFEF